MNSIHSFSEYLSKISCVVDTALNTGDEAVRKTDKTAVLWEFMIIRNTDKKPQFSISTN